MLDINEILNSKEAKFNFMKGLINIAKADGEVEEAERVFFANAAVGLGLDEEYIEKLENFFKAEDNTIDIKFESKKQSIFLIREGIQLCYVDGKYDERERKIIQEIASKVGVSESTVEKIEEWVIEGINWSRKGEELLEVEV